MNKLVYWIWLSLACTPDTPTFSKLLQSFDTAEEVYNAEDYEIRASVGSKNSDCSALLCKDLTRAEEIYKFCFTKGVGILTYEDEAFPESLRDIPTPPVLLYYRGVLPDFDKTFRCAVVGTRTLSDYGRKNAFRLGYDLACAGITVVSGMAKGIDGVALAGALSKNAQTIAVIGSGIDVCYPPEHRRLAQEIVKRGCVFTEYAPGTKPLKHNFPKRNRLISGLCSATVVVEGNESSGSLYTARYAKAQGRAVYAFPGNVGNDGSQVTNLLIKSGAFLCTGADDIVRDFEKVALGIINPFKLETRIGADMANTLKELQVSAVTPTDDIFINPVTRKLTKRKKEDKAVENAQVEPEKEENVLPSFTKEQLTVYKKIPSEGECTIESLVNDEYDLKKVMSLLLKLEMGRFVILLPGDRVKRNLR